jgi:Mg-chelatase subunit ChlI
MARPKKEGMDYFPHDTDAVNDEKIEALRMLYGNDGYAFYFILLERIYRTKHFELDVSDAETIQILAKKVDVTVQVFSNMLETAIKRGCFDRVEYEERKVLTSDGIKSRASVVVKKRVTMRQKYKEEKEDVSDAETTPETQQKVHKGKERKDKSKDKEKNTKEDKKLKYADFVKLTKAEYEKLVSEHGESNTIEMIRVLDNYKGANGKKYASDYRAILNWVVDRVMGKPQPQKKGEGQNGKMEINGTSYDFYKQREPNF